MIVSPSLLKRRSGVSIARALRAGCAWLPLVAGVASGAVLPVSGEALNGAAPTGDDSTASSFQVPTRGYHDYQEVCALVDAWVAADPRVTLVDLGTTRDGRRVPALRFQNRHEADEPRASDPVQERKVLLLGGIDGLSLAGAEATLWSAHGLLDQLDHLSGDLVFLVVPWASPDALAQTLDGGDVSGRSAAPVDDDGDGQFGEDGPDDLDGDGLVLNMAVPDAEFGEWCFAEDHRFLVPARPGDAPRYRLTREGRDDDLDGQFNEDDRGGVNYNAHFPIGWAAQGDPGAWGAWPLSESVPRRLADLCLQENVALCVSFAGSSGGIDFGHSPQRALGADGRSTSTPQEVTDAERRILLAFERVTGRMGSPTGMTQEPTGRAVDWLASVLPCVALEVAVWGPNVVGVDGRPYTARPSRLGATSRRIDRSKEALDAGRPLTGIDAAWAFWLDDVRGGAGFQDWHPVDLGQGRTGWVGGWEPQTRFNPPADCLLSALEGIPRFVHELSAGLPRLELEILSVERMGDLVQIEARVTNTGGLETDLNRQPRAGEVVIELTGVDAQSVVAGSASTTLSRLGPAESSRTLRWMIQSQPGRVIEVRATCSTAPTVVREVRS